MGLIWVLFLQKDTGIMRFAFCVNCCKPYNRAIFGKLPRVAEYEKLVSIPVNWDYSIPYGLLYSLNAPDDVKRFVDEAAKLAGKEM